jgi:hypothetical protein
MPHRNGVKRLASKQKYHSPAAGAYVIAVAASPRLREPHAANCTCYAGKKVIAGQPLRARLSPGARTGEHELARRSDIFWRRRCVWHAHFQK